MLLQKWPLEWDTWKRKRKKNYSFCSNFTSKPKERGWQAAEKGDRIWCTSLHTGSTPTHFPCTPTHLILPLSAPSCLPCPLTLISNIGGEYSETGMKDPAVLPVLQVAFTNQCTAGAPFTAGVDGFTAQTALLAFHCSTAPVSLGHKARCCARSQGLQCIAPNTALLNKSRTIASCHNSMCVLPVQCL